MSCVRDGVEIMARMGIALTRKAETPVPEGRMTESRESVSVRQISVRLN